MVGHNKFQLEIQDLNKQINELHVIINKKNEELELFKNNLKDLQVNTYESNYKHILELDKLQTQINMLNNIEIEYNKCKVEYENKNIAINTLYTNSLASNNNLEILVNNLNTTAIENSLKYSELKSKYYNNIQLLEHRSSENDKLLLLNNTLIQELNLYKDLNLTKEENIQTIKLELNNSINEITQLKNELFHKDTYLKELNKKYANEKPRKHIDNTNNTDTYNNTRRTRRRR